MVTTLLLDPAPLKDVRDDYLGRSYLHRSLLRRMAQRLGYIGMLADRARAAAGVTQLYAWLDVLYHTWLLIEQTRKVYELVASQVDVRFARQRRSLDSRPNNPRSAAKQKTYHQRVWLYPLLDLVPSSSFTRLGLDSERSREVLSAIVDRSEARLAEEEEALREFTQRYVDVCNAYKHGRAMFAMEPTVSITGEKTGTLNLTVSASVATVLLSESPNVAPHAFLTIRVDDELLTDIDRVLAILDLQVPRLLSYNEAFAEMIEAGIQQLGVGTNDPLPSIPFFAFGAPYSKEEQELLDAIQHETLRLYETP
jgi:hypothetical protein